MDDDAALGMSAPGRGPVIDGAITDYEAAWKPSYSGKLISGRWSSRGCRTCASRRTSTSCGSDDEDAATRGGPTSGW